jgi:uncharacterized membrane protein
MPSWDGLHPLIIHFPIALLIVAPILVLLGIVLPRKGRTFLISAFVLMALGTLAAYVASSTGEAAGELAERIAAVEPVLEQHEELAETTIIVFSVLTAVFGVIVFAPMVLKKDLNQAIVIPLNLAFLLFYGAGVVLLVNTAHQGGMLVHQYGVHAMMTSTAQSNPPASTKESRRHDDDD